jgi:uncharacterized RDD family membrane protein YckC
MLPAGILGFMLPGDPEEGFSADPPIQRSAKEEIMEFLPLYRDGKKVYAGFWRRLCAGWIDTFIIVPLVYLFELPETMGLPLAIILTILSTALFSMYNVIFNACYGGSPGKLAVGIRITRPNGYSIGWSEAWKRSAVDIIIALILVMADIWTLLHLDWDKYSSLGWIDRIYLRTESAPTWCTVILLLQDVWVWSEVFVLLFSDRKRAIHDFIAGTVVIKKEFAEHAPPGGHGEAPRR